MSTMFYLFVGGPKHGEWLPVAEGTRTYVVSTVTPPDLYVGSFDPVVPKLNVEEKEIYHLQHVGFGSSKAVDVFLHHDLMKHSNGQAVWDAISLLLAPKEQGEVKSPLAKKYFNFDKEPWHFEYGKHNIPTKPAEPPKPKKDQITISVGDREVSWDLSDSTEAAVLLQWLIQTRGPGVE